MVPGCEHFRTTLKEAEELEKAVRGTTAGFNLTRGKGNGKNDFS